MSVWDVIRAVLVLLAVPIALGQLAEALGWLGRGEPADVRFRDHVWPVGILVLFATGSELAPWQRNLAVVATILVAAALAVRWWRSPAGWRRLRRRLHADAPPEVHP